MRTGLGGEERNGENKSQTRKEELGTFLGCNGWDLDVPMIW